MNLRGQGNGRLPVESGRDVNPRLSNTKLPPAPLSARFEKFMIVGELWYG